jgi:propionyl-CoA synthetase
MKNVSRETSAIESEVVKLIRDAIGPVAAFKTAITVDRLPKTRSGKILRGTIKKIADGIPWKMPATIDDPAILEEIAEALRKRGFGSLPM